MREGRRERGREKGRGGGNEGGGIICTQLKLIIQTSSVND